MAVMDSPAPASALYVALMGLYPQIKQGHIALVGGSGALFAARGLGVWAGARWPMAAWARRLSVIVDTLLFTAGVSLWALLGLNPVRDAWLGTKLLLLLAYIVVGSLALKRARTARVRRAAFVAALALYGFMVSVAVAHRPLGLLASALAG